METRKLPEKLTSYQCKAGAHEDKLAGCPGFNTDDKGKRYECDCPCHRKEK